MCFRKNRIGCWIWDWDADFQALCAWMQDLRPGFFRENDHPGAEKMPDATLISGDFSEGLAEPLTHQKYDAIIATYSLHHLTDDKKISLITSLLPLLNDGGSIYIGDVAFDTRATLEKCRDSAGDDWDDDEIYFVYDELKSYFHDLQFEQVSYCAGLLSLYKY